MGFILLLITTTLSIAGSAAFFSIYGLAAIFSGIFWPVVIMGTSLEVGKLVGVSFLYRYWKDISILMKTYLMIAIFILMLITSAGIFGFLSMGYQQDTLPLKLMEQKISLEQEEKAELITLKQERLDRKKQIDADIAALPNNFVTGRQRLMKAYSPELRQLKSDISDYTLEIKHKTLKIQELKNQSLQERVHTGPIIFIASVFERDVDDATKWLILLIIFAFDPFAVVLTIGTNIAIFKRNKDNGLLGNVDPTVENLERLLNQPSTQVSIEQITEILDKMNNRDLTPMEIAQQGMLREMLAKKSVTDKVRRGSQQPTS